jgi:6-phosphogluconolactonase (cycloisomerase 2 family)
LVRVLCWGPTTDNNTLAEHPPLKAAQGSGPRHAVFWQSEGNYDSTSNLYLFLVAELANSITAYKVSYPPQGGMEFTEVYTTSTFGSTTVPGAGASEIVVSPDNKFLVVSNRNDHSFSTLNPASNKTESSDSLASFAINNNGTLTFKALAAAGGSSPRQFSFNKAGDMIAVSLSNSARMAILKRNVATGEIGAPIATLPIGQLPDAGPTCIVWDE